MLATTSSADASSTDNSISTTTTTSEYDTNAETSAVSTSNNNNNTNFNGTDTVSDIETAAVIAIAEALSDAVAAGSHPAATTAAAADDEDIDNDYNDNNIDDDEDDDDDDDDDEDLADHDLLAFEQSVAVALPEVTADMVESGQTGIQGINWPSVGKTAEAARAERLRGYESYRNLPGASLDQVKKDVHPCVHDSGIYRFRYLSRASKCSITHFQLRHLIAATSKNDVYYTYRRTLRHWSPTTHKATDVVNLEKTDFPLIQISSLAARGNSLIAGGFGGEYVFKLLNSDSQARTGMVTTNTNGITNHMRLWENRNGASQCVISSNDMSVRVMDLCRLEMAAKFEMPWAVNCSTPSPDKRILCVVGDGTEGLLASADTGEHLQTLKGHVDYSFACAWSPCGRYVATGNQDMTTRVYDIRRSNKAQWVLNGEMCAIRSLQFSEDGRYLMIGESADYVHVVEMATLVNGEDGRDRATMQTIEFFGEVAGVSVVGRGGESLFIGNADDLLGGIMEYRGSGASHRAGVMWGERAGAG